MEEPIIYIKQSGELKIPVTARIEWLPNGKIKPLFYESSLINVGIAQLQKGKNVSGFYHIAG